MVVLALHMQNWSYLVRPAALSKLANEEGTLQPRNRSLARWPLSSLDLRYNSTSATPKEGAPLLRLEKQWHIRIILRLLTFYCDTRRKRRLQ